MIPVVDLQSSTATAELVEALSSIGFVELVGHGVDADVVAAQRVAADAFFALPEDVKRRHVHPEPLANRGFRAKGSEALRYSLGEASPPDLFESFNTGPDHVEGGWTDLVQPTPWPDEVPQLRTTTLALRTELQSLSHRLDGLIGTAIGIDGLAARSTTGPDMLATIDYRPGPDGAEASVPGQQRMGAHSDYTTFTILLPDPVPGLQIVGTGGDWVDVVPQPGSALVNVGDLLAMWTNDAWPSTLHRVIPMSAGAAAQRRSVAYFHYPDTDVVVQPLARFCDAQRPARYEPVSVEAHVRGKLSAPKVQEAATGASTVADRGF